MLKKNNGSSHGALSCWPRSMSAFLALSIFECGSQNALIEMLRNPSNNKVVAPAYTRSGGKASVIQDAQPWVVEFHLLRVSDV
jgi:hypothetical protein